MLFAVNASTAPGVATMSPSENNGFLVELVIFNTSKSKKANAKVGLE
jgi:hypothetical protein